MGNDPLYFIGITPPVEIQREITRFKEYFRDTYGSGHALKSPPHITLVPPFRFPLLKEKTLINDLNDFVGRVETFSIRLENFNAFVPRVIFVDVKTNEKLRRLHEKISDLAAEHWGTTGDIKKARHFSPHITVAFKDLRKADFYAAWPEFRNKKISFEFIANSITLFKHNGKIWDKLFEAGFAISEN